MYRLLLVVFLTVTGITLNAQTTPLPFEPEIRAFEKQDSLNPPIKGQIVLYGSSTFRLWKTYQEDLAQYMVVNRGFGGSQTPDAIRYFDRAILPLQPSWILFYEGDNDLASGEKTAETVFEDFKTFVALVKEKLPKTKIAVYTLRPSVLREARMPQQQKLNALFDAYCKEHRRKVYLINVFQQLLTPEGRPNGSYLVSDNLHMNAQGYAVWTKNTLAFFQSTRGFKKLTKERFKPKR
jgi:lysophospholipase L1-like esterase